MKKTELDPQKTIFLIDGSSFLYRSYYGLRPIYTSKGLPVNAVFNFCRIIKKLIDQFDPKFLALVWDSKGKTVRHEIFENYKATRQAPPSDLFTQKEYIKNFANLIGLAQVEQPGYEADDLMYSLTKDFVSPNNNIVIITSDKDMGQVLGNNVYLLDTFKDELQDLSSFEKKMDIPAQKLPFYFALLGDTSDNIPGVKGIGKKGALDLVKQFESLDDLYNHLDQVPKERTRTALLNSKDNAFLSLELFLLRYFNTNLKKEDLVFDKSKWAKAQPLFEELEFKSLLKDLEKYGIAKSEITWLSKAKGYRFITVTSPLELYNCLTLIEEKKICAIDTELTGIDPMKSLLVGISICVEKGTAYYIPFGHQTGEFQLSRAEIVDALKPLFADTRIKKYMHHAKFDEHALLPDLPIKELIFDTLIAASLVTQDWQRSGLKHLSKFYLNEEMLSFQDVVTQNGYLNFSQVPLSLAAEYAAADAHQTFQLVPILEKELEDKNMKSLYEKIEFPLIHVLLKMEQRGIRCDIHILKDLDKQITQDIEKTQEQILSLISESYKNINLNSPKQLEQLLFQELKLPPQKKSGKGTGYSTDQEVLEELAKHHPVPALIVRYRGLYKLKSTYIDALPTYINPKTSKIHTTFSQTRVATGRLASSDPNLQNIPTDISSYKTGIRTAFIPDSNHLFISADYSQIELRVLAYLSQDKNLIQAFLAGHDIHSQTAAGLFDVPLEKVTNQQRQIGKRINFSILYGLTPFGLSKDMGISLSQAKVYIEKYFAQYPEVSNWMDNIIQYTKEHGFVTTHWGRRRYIPGIYEKNKNLYDLAKRIAINTVAQGTAAEIMKLGMIALDAHFEKQKVDAHLLLQIHDELIISVHESLLEKTKIITREILENIVSWNIPLEVDIKFGKNWQEITK